MFREHRESRCPLEPLHRRVGRELLWNGAFPYKFFKKLWPGVEVNYTHFYEGEHQGNTVVYLTPGLVLGPFHLFSVRFPFWSENSDSAILGRGKKKKGARE